jgi:hypothetical protein
MSTLSCPACGLRFQYTYQGAGRWSETLDGDYDSQCREAAEGKRPGSSGAPDCREREKAKRSFREKVERDI